VDGALEPGDAVGPRRPRPAPSPAAPGGAPRAGIPP
jgi:hypothetical protein